MRERTEATTFIRARPETVLEVVGAFEEYPEWIAEIKRVEVRSRDASGRGREVFFAAQTPLGKAEYTLEYTWDDAGHRLSWRYLGGTVRDISGEYRLDPEPDGTRLTYRLQVDVGIRIPGLVRRQLERMVMRAALDGLKKRAEARESRAPGG
jgi:ribosome-associated toxin RatA of RatAB toxin-antitoxin module